MGWLVEGPWATKNGIDWTAEMSQLTHEGGWGECRLPNTNLVFLVVKNGE